MTMETENNELFVIQRSGINGKFGSPNGPDDCQHLIRQAFIGTWAWDM
jgi:hypothetical protein